MFFDFLFPTKFGEVPWYMLQKDAKEKRKKKHLVKFSKLKRIGLGLGKHIWFAQQRLTKQFFFKNHGV